MDWINTLSTIKKKLGERGYQKSVDKIIEAQMCLGTPGEMYLEVMNVLLAMRNSGSDDYLVIKDEVNALLDYGKSIRYFDPDRTREE